MAYICDGCVALCVEFIRQEANFDQIFSRSAAPQSADPNVTSVPDLRGASSEQLEDALERGKRGMARNRRAVQVIERRLADRADEDLRGDEGLPADLAFLRNKSREELVARQQTAQAQLRRYEEGLRIATRVLAERGQQSQ